MFNNNGKLAGILGTIIIHLIIGIIFISLQLRSLQKKIAAQYEVELLAPAEPPVKKENPVQVPASTVEKVLKGDQEMLNIAKNLSAKPDEKIDPKDYENKVREELIKSGKIASGSNADNQNNSKESSGGESIIFKSDSVAKELKEKTKSSQELAANYKGPTRIYYDLFGRTHQYLPIPIYKCEGSGKVVLSIEVDQKGVVQKAQISERESTASDPCLIETAINTALESRFNPDANAPRIQIGSLTYQFVAQ
jgi:hypothetical protein